jgi:DNA-binding NarL/FixJ family response regulator
MITVLVVDDHPVVRQGIVLMLDTRSDVEVVGAAADGDEAVRMAAEKRPDVILMDLSMPGRDGTVAIRDILANDSEIAIIALTSFSDRQRIVAALDAGAVGYMLKDADPEALVAAIHAASRGESPLHPKAARVALQRRDEPTALVSLSRREREVLKLVMDGLTNAAIARRLGISERTVKGHLSSIFASLGVRDRTSAALWAQRNRFAG